MATRATFTPYGAELTGDYFPELGVGAAGRPHLGYDSVVIENAAWTFVAPEGLTTPLEVRVHYRMASATTGVVQFRAQLEAVGDGDTQDTEAAGYDTVNTVDETVPGVVGRLGVATVPLTNADGIAAGDLCRLRVGRNASDAADTAAGDCEVLAVELVDSA